MKKQKIFFNFAVLFSIALLSVGFASAVDFVSPQNYDYVAGIYFVAWENGEFGNGRLGYLEGTCDDSAAINWELRSVDFEGSYSWDTNSLEDGTYCLKIVSENGLEASVTVIIDNTAPLAEFEVIGNQIVDEILTFDASASSDENGIEFYEWDFGDGNVATGMIVEHFYSEEGVYLVTLYVRDYAGNEASTSRAVFITEVEPEWRISLNVGVNYISIPFVPESTHIDEVFGEEVSSRAEAIWSYIPGERRWIYNTPVEDGSRWTTYSGRVNQVVPGHGYVLIMDEESVAYGDGRSFGPETGLPGVTLATGWNLVGHYGANTLDVSTALGNLMAYKSSLFRVDQEGRLRGDVTAFEMGKAYWLHLDHGPQGTPNEIRFFNYVPSPEAY